MVLFKFSLYYVCSIPILKFFIFVVDSDIKIPIFEAFEIREDHSITMAATQAKIGTNVKKETNNIDDEKFNKNFGYEIENKRLTNVNEIHLRQENLPQNHVSFKTIGFLIVLIFFGIQYVFLVCRIWRV